MTRYIVTAGDCTSDNLAKKYFPDLELVSLTPGDNGMAAIDKFNELGNQAALITSTTPLQLSKWAPHILEKFAIKEYYHDLNYYLMTANAAIAYSTKFPGCSLGGISPLINKIAAQLIDAGSVVNFTDHNDSTAAALDGTVDLVCKPGPAPAKIDGLHLVCDLSKEHNLKLRYYLLEHGAEHNAQALAIFKNEREEIQKFLTT